MEDYKKKYEEALERTMDMLSYKEVRQEDMEYIFPELKDSEDERIKKALIALLIFSLEDGSAIAPGFNETKEQALAWLEKQGKDIVTKAIGNIWHKPDEEPKRNKEILVEYKSGFHDVGYYDEDEKIFYTGFELAKKDDITRWAYIEDLTKL